MVIDLAEQKGKIILYNTTDSNSIFFLVYKSNLRCPCKCAAYFDGNLRLLLNIKNRYFTHYDLLYEYSDLMTSSRNTLHGYLR